MRYFFKVVGWDGIDEEDMLKAIEKGKGVFCESLEDIKKALLEYINSEYFDEEDSYYVYDFNKKELKEFYGLCDIDDIEF